MSPSEPETEFSDSSADSPKKKKKGKKSKVEARVSFQPCVAADNQPRSKRAAAGRKSMKESDSDASSEEDVKVSCSHRTRADR